jgi:hypothetical protein
MPRVCTVCTHPGRPAIDMALVNRKPFRTIADQFRVSKSALIRHHDEHLPATLAKAHAADETAAALDVMAELRRCFERVTLLFDACDRWLRDADDPGRYDLGPRASELLVTYEQADPETGRVSRRKAPLSALLARVEGGLTVGVTLVETKHTDPRELVLKTADRLRAQTELLAKLLGELDERPQVTLVTAPEWLQLRAALLDALRPHPEARSAVAARLLVLEGGRAAG